MPKLLRRSLITVTLLGTFVFGAVTHHKAIQPPSDWPPVCLPNTSCP